MSNGDDDAEDADSAAAEGPVAAFEERLDDAATQLDTAETEAELDEVETELDDIEARIEEADLPEPDEDDEDAEDPRADLESRLADLREELDEQRGPYVEDVASIVEDAHSTVADSEWTDDGEGEAVTAVASFLEAADEYVSVSLSAGNDPESAASALDAVAGTIADADLDPDADSEDIAALLEAAETLEDDLEAAETWGDLTVQEQLSARGFYDILNDENHKDFPPEWSAIKLYRQEGEVEPILYALDKLGDSDFFEAYVFDQFLHMGKTAAPAFDEIHQRAQKRNKEPIQILGKIADDRAAETLHDFIDGDGDASLQKITLRALGEIGAAESTQPVANRLAADDPEIRSIAARSLGMIGDTRAIQPLSDVLAEDDEDTVRASAAWALRQIGTARALEVASEYIDDRAYLVQAEAEKAAGV